MAEDHGLGARYEVLRTVSEGRRATVLQAIDHVHDRLVALKVYPAAGGDREELLAEARLLMSIAPHPALPVIRGDFFTDDGDRYVMVMNWVDGTDLQQLLDEQGDPGLSLWDVLDDLAQVADALDHLHAHQPAVVHGDVKPANIVRCPEGRVVLVDFDIAGIHPGGVPMGTRGYVAPEVGAGEKPTGASDVYALAATAVTLLNGHPPADAAPTYPGVAPADQAQLARVLRAGLAVDPVRRPRSAGRLIESLRNLGHHDQPTGVIALLAAEVADAARLWDRDPDEMRAAMGRLREVRDEVVELRGGRVVTSMNEGDHTIAVFREVSAAATAAIDLHDRVAAEAFPPGVEVRLQAAVAVGEANLVDGVYAGAVVDHVVRLRSVAAPGCTVTSEATAELLVGLVGREVSIVPLGPRPGLPASRGGSIFGLTRPGAESRAGLHQEPRDRPRDATHGAPGTGDEHVSRRAAAAAAFEDTSTLLPLTIAGLALIYLLVLSPELGLRGLATVVLVLSVGTAAVSFVLRWSRGIATQRTRIDGERSQREADARAQALEQERADTRRRLAMGFARITSEDGQAGAAAVDGLGDELDAVGELLRRTRERTSVSLSSAIPDLVEETYRHGMSALSDALELLEFADGPQRRRLATELIDIEDRLSRDQYDDERARSRDEQRQPIHVQLIARHDEARQRARDLVFEGERCAAALAEARIELASVRAGDTRVDADAVVVTLQETIRRVRDVQDELRRLGY